MKQGNKELLLKDLSARLSYGVKFPTIERSETVLFIDTSDNEVWINGTNINDVKPYLFPISSMTEEQKYECFKGTPLEIDKYGSIAVKDNLYGGSHYTDLEIYLEVIVWLLKNHFDIYGLIPKGLAIDATGLNIY